VKQVRFSQARAAVNEKRIISIARRLAYGHAACVREAIAGADYEIFKGIIRVKRRLIGISRDGGIEPGMAVWAKCDGYKMARDLLRGPGEGASAVTLQKLCACLIGAADFKRPAGKAQEPQIVEPFAGIYRVKDLCAVQNFRKDIFNIAAGQIILLYSLNQ